MKTAVLALAWFLVPIGARAEIPYLIPVLGHLADADDVPLDGSYDATFTLYTAAEGGATLWGETYNAAADSGQIVIEDGLFRAYLGTENPLSMEPFFLHDEIWLGLRVGSDNEMSRVRLAAVPWAFECGEVTDLDAAGIQPAIGAGACGANQAMRGWSGSAAVCVDLPSIAGLVATSDIGVTVQAAINQAQPCSYGIRELTAGGAVTCVQDREVVLECGPEAAGGSLSNYLGSDGACHKAVHSCATGLYIDSNGVCHTPVSSSGTALRVPLFTSAYGLADSALTQSSSTSVVTAGSGFATTTLSASGAVNAGSTVTVTGAVNANGGVSTTYLDSSGNITAGGNVTATGTVHATGGLNVGGGAFTVSSAGVTNFARYQRDNAAETRYDISPRYHLSLTAASYSLSSKVIPQATLVALCADSDGCEVRLGMTRWNANTEEATASRSFLFYYHEGTHRWRTSEDVFGIDGNNSVQHAKNIWDTCYFTDGHYVSVTSYDTEVGMELLVWNGYANAGRTCELTIID
jgi:hypothetical protein